MRPSKSFRKTTVRTGLAAALLFAPTGMTGASALHGLLVYSHEVHTLQPCGEQRSYWLHAPRVGQQLATAYQRLAKRPYEPVYAELEGVYVARPASGFAADYNGTFAVHEIHSVSAEPVAACRDGNL